MYKNLFLNNLYYVQIDPYPQCPLSSIYKAYAYFYMIAYVIDIPSDAIFSRLQGI